MNKATTYRLGLTSLDDESATFGDGLGGDRAFPMLILPVNQWVSMDRPGWIEVTPQPVIGAAAG